MKERKERRNERKIDRRTGGWMERKKKERKKER
jgi:hypothetical protein